MGNKETVETIYTIEINGKVLELRYNNKEEHELLEMFFQEQTEESISALKEFFDEENKLTTEAFTAMLEEERKNYIDAIEEMNLVATDLREDQEETYIHEQQEAQNMAVDAFTLEEQEAYEDYLKENGFF